MLTVLLGSTLKFEGRFILQTQSDGPVRMLVIDYTTPEGCGPARASMQRESPMRSRREPPIRERWVTAISP